MADSTRPQTPQTVFLSCGPSKGCEPSGRRIYPGPSAPDGSRGTDTHPANVVVLAYRNHGRFRQQAKVHKTSELPHDSRSPKAVFTHTLWRRTRISLAAKRC